ncbi:hypothetical protein BKA93DRAFT_758010 [Sparassis latifolia]
MLCHHLTVQKHCAFSSFPARAASTHRRRHCYVTSRPMLCHHLTVQKLILDVRRYLFSHGQLYSAMTCVPNAHDTLQLQRET